MQPDGLADIARETVAILADIEAQTAAVEGCGGKSERLQGSKTKQEQNGNVETIKRMQRRPSDIWICRSA